MNNALPGDIRAILFDLDGTLIYADQQAAERIVDSLACLHFLASRQDILRLVKRFLLATEVPSNYLLAFSERLGFNTDALGLANRLRRLKGVGTRDSSALIPGALELLRTLKGRYRLAVVTARSRSATSHFLKTHMLTDLIEVATTRQDTWFLKPHPAPIRRTAKLLGIPATTCLMVGDTPMDIKSAKSAGAAAVGVLSGFSDEAELRRAGADLVLERVTDLAQVLAI